MVALRSLPHPLTPEWGFITDCRSRPALRRELLAERTAAIASGDSDDADGYRRVVEEMDRDIPTWEDAAFE